MVEGQVAVSSAECAGTCTPGCGVIPVMQRLALLSGLLVLFAGTAAAKGPGLPLLGIVGKEGMTQQLVRFDSSTLRALPGRVALAGHRSGWSFSPDGRLLALGYANESCVGGATSLRLVDVGHMRVLGDVRLVANGAVVATAWPDASHVLALVAVSDCITTKETVVISIDATSRRVLAETPLHGDVLSAGVVQGTLVLLLAPHHVLGRARVVAVDAVGRARETTLRRIEAGRVLPSPNMGSSVVKVDVPGLAIDAGSGTAYVLPAGDRVAAIDVRTLTVEYHDLADRSLAKGDDGPTRQAVWLGNGRIAVTGIDSVDRAANGHVDVSRIPAGLTIVDTRDWTFRKLDPQVSSVELSGGVLLATGWSYSYDGSHAKQSSSGLIVYSLGGRERYRLFEGRGVEAAAIGRRGYATVSTARARSRTVVFDLASGAIGRDVSLPIWAFLLGARAPLGY
jgi:hypothetical protein